MSSGVAHAGLLSTEIPRAEIGRFGIILTDESGDFQRDRASRPATAPSTRINVSKYLFDKQMFGFVQEVMQRPPAANGEYQVIEALNLYVAAGNRLPVVPIESQYLDCGTLEGWLHANNVVLGGDHRAV